MSAVISDDGKYRYWLERDIPDSMRRIDLNPFTLGLIMINPSTADHTLDDATIRRVKGLAGDLGADRVCVANLFAFRSPSVLDLTLADVLGTDVIGPENPAYITKLLDECRAGGVVVGFGNYNKIPKGLDFVLDDLLNLADKKKVPLFCWGKNKDGSPKHPLYLPKGVELERWSYHGWPIKDYPA